MKNTTTQVMRANRIDTNIQPPNCHFSLFAQQTCHFAEQVSMCFSSVPCFKKNIAGLRPENQKNIIKIYFIKFHAESKNVRFFLGGNWCNRRPPFFNGILFHMYDPESVES